jgi:Sec-independent protein translocase protein TatA
MTPPLTAFISPGSGEFLLIMLVLILLFGAKDAPRIFRTLHTMLDKIQRTAASFRYKMMYGDLFQDTATPTDKPYDVEEEPSGQKPEDGEREAEDIEQEAGTGNQVTNRSEPDIRNS